ncbi:MAG: hypothetical protein ACSHXL_06780 [Bacteroidota bacterium]
MKTRILLLISICLSLSAWAESDIAIVMAEARSQWPNDKDMQKYHIKSEKEEIEALRRLTADAVVKSAILKVIKSNAKRRFPRDFKMQSFITKDEMQAVRELHTHQKPKEMSQSIYNQLRKFCEKEKKHEYRDQLINLRDQIEAWEAIQKRFAGKNLTAKEREWKNNAEAKWPGDYKMQVYELKN